MKEEQKNNFIEIVQKVERLTSAVFLVSDTMSEGEVLKVTVRNISLDLISRAASLNNGSVGEKIKTLYAVQSLALNLSSIFQVASISGLVSTMNASIIRENIDGFLKFLNSYSLHLEGVTQSSMKQYFEVVKSPLEFATKETSAMPPKAIGQVSELTIKNGKTTRKDAREKTVLDFIKTKESVNIKDIARNVKGCSEKTIQRELLKMVDSGLVRKTGERRWSRYSYIGE